MKDRKYVSKDLKCVSSYIQGFLLSVVDDSTLKSENFGKKHTSLFTENLLRK